MKKLTSAITVATTALSILVGMPSLWASDANWQVDIDTGPAKRTTFEQTILPQLLRFKFLRCKTSQESNLAACISEADEDAEGQQACSDTFRESMIGCYQNSFYPYTCAEEAATAQAFCEVQGSDDADCAYAGNVTMVQCEKNEMFFTEDYFRHRRR